jgi:hypothetical protein
MGQQDVVKRGPTDMDELWTAVEEIFRAYDDENIDNSNPPHN